jgi:hypothetical protein
LYGMQFKPSTSVALSILKMTCVLYV